MVRAAELQKEADTARAETERLKAKFAWRELSENDANKFVRALNGQSIGVVWSGDDPERIEYAEMFVRALTSAGLSAGYGGGGSMNPPPPGLSVASRNGDTNAQAVISALNAIGLEAKLVPPGPIGADVTLFVGTKPRPKL
jgi:hypothetical protein